MHALCRQGRAGNDDNSLGRAHLPRRRVGTDSEVLQAACAAPITSTGTEFGRGTKNAHKWQPVDNAAYRALVRDARYSSLCLQKDLQLPTDRELRGPQT